MNVTNIDLTSIGNAASQLQIPLSRIEQIAELLGITRTSRINGARYFSREELERISERLREEQSDAI